MLYTSCVLQVPQLSQRGVACETIVSGPSPMALCARNAHITICDVTTWSWVNLVNPTVTPVAAVNLALMEMTAWSRRARLVTTLCFWISHAKGA